MKYFFLFLLLMPSVSAIAVTPTSLHFGEVESYESREVLVINNLDIGAEYRLVVGEKILQEEYLEPMEKRIFVVGLNASEEFVESYVEVQENVEGSSIINSVRINVEYVQWDAPRMRFTEVRMPEGKPSQKKDYEKETFGALAAFTMISGAAAFLKKKKAQKYL